MISTGSDIYKISFTILVIAGSPRRVHSGFTKQKQVQMTGENRTYQHFNGPNKSEFKPVVISLEAPYPPQFCSSVHPVVLESPSSGALLSPGNKRWGGVGIEINDSQVSCYSAEFLITPTAFEESTGILHYTQY